MNGWIGRWDLLLWWSFHNICPVNPDPRINTCITIWLNKSKYPFSFFCFCLRFEMEKIFSVIKLRYCIICQYRLICIRSKYLYSLFGCKFLSILNCFVTFILLEELIWIFYDDKLFFQFCFWYQNFMKITLYQSSISDINPKIPKKRWKEKTNTYILSQRGSKEIDL